MSRVGEFDFRIYPLGSVWSWISDLVLLSLCLPGRKEGNQVGKAMWDQIMEDPDC